MLIIVVFLVDLRRNIVLEDYTGVHHYMLVIGLVRLDVKVSNSIVAVKGNSQRQKKVKKVIAFNSF
jgi:hypothetical protein